MENMISNIVAALAGEINSPARSPALNPFARLLYPPRGVVVNNLPDGAVVIELAKIGYEYKHRGPRPKQAPHVDAEAISQALAPSMPHGVKIRAVNQTPRSILLTLSIEKGVESI